MNAINTAGTGPLAVQEASLRSEINYAIAAKQKDAQEMQGEAVLQMIETAVETSQQMGKGNQLDSLA